MPAHRKKIKKRGGFIGGGLASEGGGTDLFSTVSPPIPPLKLKPWGGLFSNILPKNTSGIRNSQNKK